MNWNKGVFCLIVILFFANFNLFSEIKNVANDSISPADSTIYISGNEVIITQSQKKKITGLSVGKIAFDPSAVSNLPSLFGNTDLLKLLELTPGVQNSGDANTNLYIRGGDPGHNLLLYNDVPLYTPGHLLGFFPFFTADHLASLELHKTGIPARYGGRLNSVVDVTAKKTLPEKPSIKGNAGLLSSQATIQLPLGKKFGLYVSGRKTYIELLMQPLLNVTINNNAKNKVEGLDYNFYDANITLTGDISEKDKITIDAFLGKDNFHISDNDLLLNGNLYWRNNLLSAEWDTRIRGNPFSQQVYWSFYDNKLMTNQAEMNMDITAEIQDWGYKNSYLFSIQDIPVETGLQYARHAIQPQTYTIVNAGQNYRQEAPTAITAHDAGLYMNAHFPLTSRLNIHGGLRSNVFVHEKTFFSLEPRILLQYRLNETALLHAAYNRQNQYMNKLTPSTVGIPLDFWIAASGKIAPQSGNEFSAGYFQSFRQDDFELSGEIFYHTMNQVNEYFQTFMDGQANNTLSVLFGTGRAYGLEILFKKNYGKLTGWLSYTLARSERTFDEINQGRKFPAQFDRRHDLSIVTAYPFSEKWDASLVYVYATGNAYTLPSSWYFINRAPVKEYGDYNTARMPAYNRMDLSVNYWYKKDNGINFSVYNVFWVNNPVYIFMNVKQDEETGIIQVEVKQKRLYTFIPSISWRFKF
jgi:hypothetical protein